MSVPIGERIKILRTALNITQEELGSKVGVQRAAINKYEKGVVSNIKRDMQIKLADALRIDPATLFYDEDFIPELYAAALTKTNSSIGSNKLKAVRIPVLGRVQAGLPIEAHEEILDYEAIEPSMALNGVYFGLQVRGDSMMPRFVEGDVVIVRQQEDAECGDIVIALVDGDEVTIKKLIKYEDNGIALVALNPTYQPMRFSEEEIISKPVNIIGRVVELRGKF